MRIRRPILAAVAIPLALGVAAADPLPEGAAAPQRPDVETAPDRQPPTTTEQQDVPPVATQEKPAPPAQPEAPPQKAAESLKNVEPVAPTQAFSVLGKKVHGADGKDVLGSIIDILVDDHGRPRAAIVDFGGFLGVGSRKIAVDWQLMKFHPTDPAVPIVLDLDRKQIQAAPEYKDPTQPAEVVEPAVAETPVSPPPVDPTAPAEPAPAAVPPVAPGAATEPAMPPPDAAAQPNADKHKK
jgi:hypothetical protein